MIQDGSSFAVKDSLGDVFPGRFKRVSPAAVELHVSMDLLSEALGHVTLTPVSGPSFPSLGVYPAAYLPYVGGMIKAGASFVLRTKSNLNPLVVNAYGKAGKRLRRFVWEAVAGSGRTISQKDPVDLDVGWRNAQRQIFCRLVVNYNPKTREFRYLLTNLPRTRYAAEQVGLAYKLRWQIELLFKEWKSYANLHAFDTGKSEIAEGLIRHRRRDGETLSRTSHPASCPSGHLYPQGRYVCAPCDERHCKGSPRWSPLSNSQGNQQRRRLSCNQRPPGTP